MSARDEHLDKAIASLDDVPIRELEATAEAFGSRRHPLFAFAGIFRGVAYAREGGWDDSLPRFHLGQAVGAPTKSSKRGSRTPRRRFGGMCATRWPSGIHNSAPIPLLAGASNYMPAITL
jgi:hypothetical protein